MRVVLVHGSGGNAASAWASLQSLAERAILPGAGHSIPRAPGYDALLEKFLSR